MSRDTGCTCKGLTVLPTHLRALAAAIRAAYAPQNSTIDVRLRALDTLTDAALDNVPSPKRETFAAVVHGA